MLNFIRRLFETDGFPPRWRCGTGWTSELGWTHIISDLAIWGSYTAIPVVLALFVLRRKDVPFPRVFWLFIAFIFLCGTVHLIEAIIFWEPVYRLAGMVKAATAVVSIATVVALVPVLPVALSLRSPDELEREVKLRTQHLQESEAHQRVLMSELDHRVKNNIASIMSLAEQTMNATEGNFDAFRKSFLGRLAALTRMHDALSAAKWSGANVRKIIDLTLTPYETHQHHPFSFDGPIVQVNANAASALCMALHELATNSVKYGALSTVNGTIAMSWQLRDDGLHFSWIERGGPPVKPPARAGFGTVLLRGMLEHNLEGKVNLRYPEAGVECDFHIPTNHIAQSAQATV